MLAGRGAGPLRVGEEAREDGREDGADGVVKPLGIQREGMLLYMFDVKPRWQVKGRQLSDRVYRPTGVWAQGERYANDLLGPESMRR